MHFGLPYIEKLKNLLWKSRKQLTDRQFLFLLSIVVGLLSASAAIFLKSFVFYLHRYLHSFNLPDYQTYLMVLLPSAGILLTVTIIRLFWKDEFNKGIGTVLKSIHNGRGHLPFSQTYNHIITSGITVGFGGSAGLESPIVSTGAAIGANFADFNNLRFKERTLLLACGIAAGVSAAFNAPIAGVLFAAEVFLIEISISAIIPIILASATGALLSKIILKESILLHFQMQEPFNSNNLPFYIVLGLLTGFISLWFSRTFNRINEWFSTFSNPFKAAVAGSLMLGALLLVFPSFYGEGYEYIKDLASFHTYKLFEGSVLGNFMERRTWLFIAAIFLTALLKVLATSFTLGAGGNGGQFAPSLFIGANAGFAFAMACHKIGFIHVSISNFTIVAMAGVLSGVFYAPMTGIFLIAELTGGYDLMIPLMLVSALSYSIVRRFQPISMEFQRLKTFAKWKTSKEDSLILSKLEVNRMIDTDYDILDMDMNLGDFVKILETSRHNSFPVVDKSGKFKGIVAFRKVKEMTFKPELYDKVFISQILEPAKETIQVSEPFASIFDKFEKTFAYRLPVLNGENYLGFITKGTILSQYRSEIISHTGKD